MYISTTAKLGPGGETPPMQVVPLTVPEIERLAAGAVSQRDRAAILVMAYGGLRAGEVGGLRDADVDWDAGRLHLRQQAIDSRSGKSRFGRSPSWKSD
jgi:integrase